MNNLLTQLGIDFDFIAAFLGWGLIFTRTFVMMMLTPFLGGRGVPGRIRLVLGIVLATFIFFLMGDDFVNQVPEDKGLLIALFFKEIFFGLVLGLATIMCFYAIDAGGRIIDNQRGSANAQIFVPQLGQVSIFGLFQFWLGLSFFLFMSGHTIFLKAFMESFVSLPVFSLPHITLGVSPFLELIIRMSSDVLILGMQLAAPVLIAIFLTDIVLGIANKMAPQIHVFEIGFMIKGYAGVAMVYISILVLVTQMDVFFQTMQDNVQKLIILFGQ